jgi:hypothetical protein
VSQSARTRLRKSIKYAAIATPSGVATLCKRVRAPGASSFLNLL